MGHKHRPAIERFAEKVALADDGCLLWMASLNNKGYGTFAAGEGRSVVAHRWSYEHHVGPIPDGMTLDHLCRNRACVNPDHLEPVTQRINLLRSSESVVARNASKTHCSHGHPFSGNNLYLPASGGRHCRACIQRRSLARAGRNRKVA